MRISRATAWVMAATAVGAVLRVSSPGNGSVAHDEALFLFVTRLPTVGEMLDLLRLYESHPPFFYLIMRAWTVAGSEAAAAIVPVIASVALIPLVYRIGARAFCDLAGVLAAWIVAVNPALIFYSPQIRPYSVFMLVALVSCALFWRLTDGSRKSWIAYVVATLAMVLIHNWGWIILAAQGILLGAVLLAFPRRVPRPKLDRIGSAWLAIGVGYLPWLSAFLHQVSSAGYPPQRVSAVRAVFMLPRTMFGPATAPEGFVLLAALVAILLLDRPKLQSAPSSSRGLFAIVYLPFICIALATPLSHRSALLLEHTLATLVPFAAILIGGAVATLWRSGWRAVAGLAAIGAGALMTGELSARLRLVKSNAELVANHVAPHTRADDVILVAPEWLAPSFNHYFRLPNRQIDYPAFSREEIVPFARFRDRTVDPEAIIAATDTIAALRRRGVRVWLVTARDGVVDSLGRPRLSLPDSIGVYDAGTIRANQLRRELVRQFGAPDTTMIPPDARPGIEMMRAMLFD